jgi:glycine C-acetyltransferase
MATTRFFLLSIQRPSLRRLSILAQVIDKRLNPELDSIRQAGTWKTERIISTSQSSHIRVEHSTNDLLNFCANNYLGLSDNIEIIKAAKTALDEYGAGLSSVRFICGTQTIHKQRKIKLFEIEKKRFLFGLFS